MGIAVADLDRRPGRAELLRLGEDVGPRRAYARALARCRTFVEHEVDAALHVADEQVELAVGVPIDGKDGGGAFDLDVFAGLVLESLLAGELAFALALEDIELA